VGWRDLARGTATPADVFREAQRRACAGEGGAAVGEQTHDARCRALAGLTGVLMARACAAEAAWRAFAPVQMIEDALDDVWLRETDGTHGAGASGTHEEPRVDFPLDTDGSTLLPWRCGTMDDKVDVFLDVNEGA
jgi:hypothetical protein